jgi:hypothetical protein
MVAPAMDSNQEIDMNVLTTRNCSLAMLTALSVAILIQACGGGGNAVAQGLGNADPIEGVWESALTIRDCSTGTTLRTFKGLSVLHRGGTTSATNNNPPAGNGPAFGTWTAGTAPLSYTATYRFYRFNPDGSFAGAQNLARSLTLAADQDSMSGTISAQLLDAANNVVGPPVCGVETATRVG